MKTVALKLIYSGDQPLDIVVDGGFVQVEPGDTVTLPVAVAERLVERPDFAVPLKN